MKKSLLILSFLFLTKLSFGCMCSPPNIFLEFYTSKYVFTGKVISKTYSSDSLTYTFTINIDKHYKDGDKPKSLSFTWPSEAYLRKVSVSDCDYDVSVGNYLLVFASIRNGKLNFGLICSNSAYHGPTTSQKEELENANSFNIMDFHINFDYSLFNDTKPVTDIDRLIIPYKNKNYEGEGVIIMFDVDTSGKVTKSNIWNASDKVVFNRPNSRAYLFDIINKKYTEPKNQLEKDALKIASKIKRWQVMRFKVDNKAVNSRQYISLSLNKDHKLQWKKFYFMIN